MLDFEVRDGVDPFEVGEVTGTLKNLVSVAKHKVPSLFGTLNMRVSMKQGAKPPVFQLALWIENPAVLDQLFTLAAMVRSLHLDLHWDESVQHAAASFNAEIARHLLSITGSNHVLPPSLGVLLQRLRQDLSISFAIDSVFHTDGASDQLWQTLRAFVHSYVRDVMVLEEANPVIKNLYHGFVSCFSKLLHVTVVARDIVMRANISNVPLVALLPTQAELQEEFPMEHTQEELSAETISSRFLRYIQHKTGAMPRATGRGALMASLSEIDPLIVLIRCMQHLHDEAIQHPHLVHTAFLKSKSSMWEEGAKAGERRLEFEITQYAPLMFRTLREVVFGIPAATYSAAITSLQKMRSEGKSRCRFYISHSRQFIVKTLKKSEYIYLKEILADYFQYMSANPSSLLTKICGVYKFASTGRSFRVLVMHSVMHTPAKMLWKFDLKGSIEGRRVPKVKKPEEAAAEPHTLRDIDWGLVEKDYKLALPEPTRKELIEQLQKDTVFLADRGLMDYSLFLCARPVTLPPPEVFPSRSEHHSFQGGIQHNGLVYHMGVIDFLQKWNLRKQMEHSIKSILYSKEISAVEPKRYQQRFLAFMVKSVFASAPAK